MIRKEKMKKFLPIIAALALTAALLTSCNNDPTNDIPAETDPPKVSDETTPMETENESGYNIPGFNPADYKFYQIYEAPEGDYRRIVTDYMRKMADYSWVAGEDFTITWKKQGDFSVNLKFEKGQTYHGLPYSEARASLEQFSMFCEEGGTFTHHTYYYEEVVATHRLPLLALP